MEGLEEAVRVWAEEIGGAGEATWVTIAQAEAATGASRSALRSWYRAGAMPSRMEDGPFGPQRLVPLEAVLDRVRQSTRLRRKLEQDDLAGLGARVAAAEAELARLRARVADLEHRLPG